MVRKVVYYVCEYCSEDYSTHEEADQCEKECGLIRVIRK